MPSAGPVGHKFVSSASSISVDKTAYLETQRGTSSKMNTWDMREAMKTYARSPVHSLCALCPSPPKDQLTKTANLDTQRGKSSQKHPGDMRDAIKTYARRTVHSLCNLCFSPPSPGYCNLQAKISTSVPDNLPSAVNYNRK